MVLMFYQEDDATSCLTTTLTFTLLIFRSFLLKISIVSSFYGRRHCCIVACFVVAVVKSGRLFLASFHVLSDFLTEYLVCTCRSSWSCRSCNLFVVFVRKMYAVGLEDWKVNARAVVKLRYRKNTIMLYIF